MRLAGILLATALVAAACDGREAARPPAFDQTGEPDPAEVRVGLLYTVTGEGAEFAQAALGSMALAEGEAERRGLRLDVVEREYGGDRKAHV